MVQHASKQRRGASKQRSSTQRTSGFSTPGWSQDTELVHRAQRAPDSLRPNEILHLQRTIGNQAIQRLLRLSPHAEPTIQRRVGGLGTLQELKASPDAWNIFLLLSPQDRDDFQRDAMDDKIDVPLGVYKKKAKTFGQKTIEDWLAANIATVASSAPSMLTTGLQDVDDYGYDKLLRFRWFQVVGPAAVGGKAKTTINTVGINLHRGPEYAGLGTAWCKMGPNKDSLTFEIKLATLLGGGAAALVTQLEKHAAAHTDVSIKNMADNKNCI